MVAMAARTSGCYTNIRAAIRSARSLRARRTRGRTCLAPSCGWTTWPNPLPTHIHYAECTEIFLTNKGIEKIRNFEAFRNLETLWLNGNKLKKINNLDANFRIKTLYAQVS